MIFDPQLSTTSYCTGLAQGGGARFYSLMIELFHEDSLRAAGAFEIQPGLTALEEGPDQADLFFRELKPNS